MNKMTVSVPVVNKKPGIPIKIRYLMVHISDGNVVIYVHVRSAIVSLICVNLLRLRALANLKLILKSPFFGRTHSKLPANMRTMRNVK